MENIKQAIITESTRLFSQFGLKKTTMDEIAVKTGVAKGTLYNYFSSKEELFTEIISVESKSYIKKISKLIDEKNNPIDKIYAYVHGSMDIMHEYVNLFSIQQAALDEICHILPALVEKASDINKQINSILKGIIVQGIEQDIFKKFDIELLTETVVNLIKSSQFPFNHNMLRAERNRVKKKIDLFLEIFIAGLKK